MKQKIKVKNYFIHESGIPNVDERDAFELRVDGEVLALNRYECDPCNLKAIKLIQTYHIPLSNIMKSKMFSKDVTVQKNQNVIGRGLVGGALFGNKGMTLAALSALQTNKTERKTFLVIEYASQNCPEELQRIVFVFRVGMLMENCQLDIDLRHAISSTQPSELLINLRQKLNLGGVVVL